MALVIVLWVLTLLSVIVLEFCFSMRTELNVTRHYKEEAQLYFYAHGGIHRAIAEVIYKTDPTIHNRRNPDQTPGSVQIKIEKGEDVPPMEEEWRTDGRPYSVAFGSGEAEVRVRSETGRINLNRASDQLLKRVIKYFTQLGEQRDIIVDSILDWRDKDDLRRLNGAENDYYQSLPEPYNCKNGDFDTVEELLLVRGITPELFYGKKSKNQEEGEGVVPFGLKDIFTVFSTATQVDINVASQEVLMALFGISSVIAKKVIEVREQTGFKTLAELQQMVPEIAPYAQDARGFITFTSNIPYYTLTSWGRMKTGESKKGLECVVKIDKKEESGYKVLMWKDVLY